MAQVKLRVTVNGLGMECKIGRYRIVKAILGGSVATGDIFFESE